jgi:hypothetical protein
MPLLSGKGAKTGGLAPEILLSRKLSVSGIPHSKNRMRKTGNGIKEKFFPYPRQGIFNQILTAGRAFP